MNEVAKITVNITPDGQKALALMSKVDRSIIEAALNDKINEMPPMKVVDELISILVSIYTIAGQKSDPTTLALYADEFYQKLRLSFSFITMQEVATALKKGVYDEYGEYYGLNVKTFVSFIRAYLHSEERKAAKKIFEEKLLVVPMKEETPEQKEQVKRAFVNELYSDFLDNNLITDYIPSHLFLFLEEKKLIALNNSEKTAIKERATSYYHRLVAQGKLQGELNKAATNMQANDPDIRIINVSRQFAIYEFFEQCKAKGISKIFDDSEIIHQEQEI